MSVSVRGSLVGTAVAIIVAMVCVLFSPSALADGDVNSPACQPETEASPGFRSFLPDCRAYELVTPPYIGGQPALWLRRSAPPMSADGEHILSIDYAGFAGAENEEQSGLEEYGAIYEFSRTPSGWSAEPLEPPASQYARRQFIAVSADFSHSLWALAAHAKEGEEVGEPEENGYNFALRDTAPDGQVQFTAVGPANSPGAGPRFPEPALSVEGESSDLTHVLFSVEPTVKPQPFWPGDHTRTEDDSLYEYIGTGNAEPMLVGVRNAGPLDGKPYLNEGAELLSECGTVLGSRGEGTTYNAVSAAGGIVYFTAQHAEGCSGNQPTVNELYARINGSQTVAVSEPVMTPAREAECSGTCREDEMEENKRSAARFEGASEDGSKVFFTTHQPLLNSDDDTGRDLYMAELEGGAITRLVQISQDPTKGKPANVEEVARISRDGSHVYYVARGVLTTRPNGEGELAEEDDYNLYLYNTKTGGTSFVAALMTHAEEQGLEGQFTHEDELRCLEETEPAARKECEEEIPARVARRVSNEVPSRTGLTPSDERRPFETTPDGRFLLFTNARHLSGGEDASTVGQIFEYDSQEEKLVRISIGHCPASATTCSAGERFNNNGNTTNDEDAANILFPEYFAYTRPTEATSRLSLTENGVVVFRSKDALTPQAVESTQNVYEYRDGEVYLISPGGETASLERPENPQSEFPRLLGTDESGTDVFFDTTTSMVPQDTDTQASWYDAREGGGFPVPRSASSCSGGACQGPLSAPPFLPAVGGSETQTVNENLAAGVPKPTVKPKSKPLTRARKLATALKACHKLRSRTSRAACEKKAKAKYGRRARARKADRGGSS